MASVLLGVVTVGLVGDGFLSGSTRLLPVVTTVASGTLVGPVPNNVVVWAVVAAGLVFGLSRTGLGRTIYAVGDNPVACRLAGVRIWQVLLAVYVLSALLAASPPCFWVSAAGRSDQTNATVPALVGARSSAHLSLGARCFTGPSSRPDLQF